MARAQVIKLLDNLKQSLPRGAQGRHCSCSNSFYTQARHALDKKACIYLTNVVQT